MSFEHLFCIVCSGFCRDNRLGGASEELQPQKGTLKDGDSVFGSRSQRSTPL